MNKEAMIRKLQETAQCTVEVHDSGDRAFLMAFGKLRTTRAHVGPRGGLKVHYRRNGADKVETGRAALLIWQSEAR